MTRLLPALAASLALAVPAVATAADNPIKLQGAPSLHAVKAKSAELQFVTNKALPRYPRGGLDVSVLFEDQAVARVASAGRHGTGFKYRVDARSNRKLRVGERYTVRILIDDQDPIVREVKLHPARD